MDWTRGCTIRRPLLLTFFASLWARPSSSISCTTDNECVQACVQATSSDAVADASCSSAVCDTWYDTCACGDRQSATALRASGVCEAAPSLSDGAAACEPAFPSTVSMTLAVTPSPELRPEDLSDGRGSVALLSVLRRCVAEALGCQPAHVGALRPGLTGESRASSLSLDPSALGSSSLGSTSMDPEILWAEVDMQFCVSESAVVSALGTSTADFGDRLQAKGQEYAVLFGGTIRVSDTSFAWTTTTTRITLTNAGGSTGNQGSVGVGMSQSSDGDSATGDDAMNVADFWWALVVVGLAGCALPVLCVHLLWLRHRSGKATLPEWLARRFDAWYGSSKTKVSSIEPETDIESIDEDASDQSDQPELPDAGDFKPGSAVVIHGLQNAADLNGLEAKCERWDVHGGRWHVRLNGGREVKALKTANLKAMDMKLDLSSPKATTAPQGCSTPRGSFENLVSASKGGAGVDGLSLTPGATPRDGTPGATPRDQAMSGLPGQLAHEDSELVPAHSKQQTANGGRLSVSSGFSFSGAEDRPAAKSNAALQFAAKGASPSFSGEQRGPSKASAASALMRAPSFSDCLTQVPATAAAKTATVGIGGAASSGLPAEQRSRAPSFSDILDVASPSGDALQRAPSAMSFSDCLHEVQPPPAMSAAPRPPKVTTDTDDELGLSSAVLTPTSLSASATGSKTGTGLQRAPSFSDCLDQPSGQPPVLCNDALEPLPHRSPSFSIEESSSQTAKPNKPSTPRASSKKSNVSGVTVKSTPSFS